ncbi:MAG: tRNA pseudouridine(38-40) synthase TruA [Verrucomicrobia bacterium RIFCSPHIGHO2_12_FULL_41_10]|nr:MAG: tRNA pseudouridine(38-40) synthase TruA [Verrucomicrobia bacterium RIFCSPHIGHO2_12_FULL_41_10]HLB34219.1 tRNA pseudouridine(38-40) synthase TruA [Chthoniobacterales bacterium]
MRLKLIIAYDGSSFAGWQSQSSKRGIQDHLEKALMELTGRRIILHGAGRTDAGVHALAQCAHIDLGEVHEKMSDPARWRTALNASLTPELRVLKVQKISPSFHARFSAKSKIYRYTIWHGDVMPPLYHQRAWHLYGPFDFQLLQELGKAIIGTHDFRGFTAKLGTTLKNTQRTIHSVSVVRQGAKITISFHGNGFLYHMVRMLVGAMVRVAQGKSTKKEFLNRLHSGKPATAPKLAPAGGLTLVKVFYKDKNEYKRNVSSN